MWSPEGQTQGRGLPAGRLVKGTQASNEHLDEVSLNIASTLVIRSSTQWCFPIRPSPCRLQHNQPLLSLCPQPPGLCHRGAMFT